MKTGAGEKSISDEIVVEAVKPNHIDLSVNLLETCDNCAKNVRTPIIIDYSQNYDFVLGLLRLWWSKKHI